MIRSGKNRPAGGRGRDRDREKDQICSSEDWRTTHRQRENVWLWNRLLQRQRKRSDLVEVVKNCGCKGWANCWTSMDPIDGLKVRSAAQSIFIQAAKHTDEKASWGWPRALHKDGSAYQLLPAGGRAARRPQLSCVLKRRGLHSAYV